MRATADFRRFWEPREILPSDMVAFRTSRMRQKSCFPCAYIRIYNRRETVSDRAMLESTTSSIGAGTSPGWEGSSAGQGRMM